MQLENYFDFLAPDDIRIKDTRVGIESVLYEHIYRDKSAEQIADRFPSLTLSQIYATILYYLDNREQTEAYLLDWMNFGDEARKRQAANPPPVMLRLRKIKIQDLATV